MYKNTDLGCDLKTILRSDRTMKTGKDYPGVLRRDFSVERYAIGVSNELLWGLEGLVEKK